MSLLQRLPGVALTLAVAALVGAGAWWLVTNKPDLPKTDKPPPAAKVEKVVKEDDLARVIVGEKAVERIGLTVGAVEAKAVRRVRVYGGEVTIPDGRRIPVTASLAGTLAAPTGGMPKAGQAVKAGDALFQLLPLLSPEGRITMAGTLATADGLVKTTEKRVDAARVALDRAKSSANITGGRGPVEAAQGAYDVAVEERDVAAVNRKVLAKAAGELDKGTASPVPVLAPISGLLRVVTAQPGQAVPGGAALCEVVDLSTLWVRVPVPVGDTDAIAGGEPALVGKLAAAPGTALAPATPIPAPPSASVMAGTVDVFYELPNAGGALTPGQRVGVTVPLNDPKESLTVPWSAVVFDTHGGNWIFEETAARTFYRRRVVVAYTDPANPVTAVLKYDADDRARAAASGMPELKAGTRIATAGVQELFGAETGFIK